MKFLTRPTLLAHLTFAASLGNPPAAPYAVQTPPLDTRWTYEVGTNPWPEHPRPKLKREQWQSLNGVWTYSNASSLDAVHSPPFNQTLERHVLVPFCLESGLSGIQGVNVYYSWYQTTFTIPSHWTGDRAILHFDAVDYETTVFVNARNATFHRGGYFAFSIDVTPYLKPGASNELLVFVHDPTDRDPYVIPIGKQALSPLHTFYRPCSGIWQSVWLESAPTGYISDLNINGDASGNLNITVGTTGNATTAEVQVRVCERSASNGTSHRSTTASACVTGSGNAGSPFTLKVQSPKLWSPNNPSLYDVTLTLGDDEVSSYTGFRSIGRADFQGVQRIVLNGEPVFAFGTLDQGYWPDGLYTPPTYDAMTYDIKTLKEIGYNMLRKHIKVESHLFYTACDEIGILVMQDMPSLRPWQSRVLDNYTTQTILPDQAQQEEFQRQLELLVTQFRSYTSIFAWVIYNEGWGQITSHSPEFDLTRRVRRLDPTRLVNSATGWYDHGAGDFSDNHHYANPQCGTPWSSINSSPFDPARIGFQGEFGGAGHNVSAEHLWKVPAAVDSINGTYEIHQTIDIWNARGHALLRDLLAQVEAYSCAGAVWTQTTDVEGELNGMLTYDRRVLRTHLPQWTADIQALYDASARRSRNARAPVFSRSTECDASAVTPWEPGYYSTYHWTPAGPARTTAGGGGVPGGWPP